MDNKTDYFQRKMYSTKPITRHRKNSNKWIRIIVILLLIALWLVGRKLFWAPTDLWWDIEQVNANFSLQEQVYLQWELRADGDIITHTHTIEDETYWKIWIKSDSINLFDYAWFV